MRARSGAGEIDDAHVGHVEHAGVASHRVVLLDLRAVVHRHVPAAEVDHACARGAVRGIERRLLEHWGPPARNDNRAKRYFRSRPVCPLYLRDLEWRVRACRVPTPGAPSVDLSGSRQAISLALPSAALQIGVACVQSSVPERFREYAFGGRSAG